MENELLKEISLKLNKLESIENEVKSINKSIKGIQKDIKDIKNIKNINLNINSGIYEDLERIKVRLKKLEQKEAVWRGFEIPPEILKHL